MPNGRAQAVLERFPRHWRADEPAKLLGFVVEALAREVDGVFAGLGRVRRAHRLAEAETEGDLLLLGGLHGLEARDLDLMRVRLAAVSVLADEIGGGGAPATTDARLEALLNVTADSFPPWPGEADDGPARMRLAAALRRATGFTAELALTRRHIGAVIAAHRGGNTTAAALLSAGASALALDALHVEHMADGYWHVARCADRIRLHRPEPPGAADPETIVAPAEDLLALEENPEQLKGVEPVPRARGERFSILRKGFEPTPATVRVRGIGERTVWPMVVNLGTGRGVAFRGAVPDGQELRFEMDGRVLLEGAEVGGFAWHFEGGVFADAASAHPHDFVFADAEVEPAAERAARFAVTGPMEDRFEPDATFPAPIAQILPVEIGPAESRWAFFVRAAHFGGTTGGNGAARPTAAVPVFDAGVFDGSVWAHAPDEVRMPAGELGFEWLQREPFAVCLWLPERFRALDQDGETEARERVRIALDRHRAAGVRVAVKYASTLWTLSEGVLRDAESGEPIGVIVRGTRLSPDDGAEDE